MTPISLALWAAGVILIVVGYTRARGPWSRYQQLREEDQNAARYAAWRGGARNAPDASGSVAMEVLRRQARLGASIAIAGFVLVFLGFLIR